MTNVNAQQLYNDAKAIVDEQALLDKFNAATTAQYNLQREQNRQAENQFYNQMYNTQQTAVDAIRQANAAAVSTGASRGIQAANELSAILGLQQESVASATELAQANRQTAQEETAAVLENVLNAYQQAEQQRQNLVTAGIQAESVNVQSDANRINELSMLWTNFLQAQANGDKDTINAIAAQINKTLNGGNGIIQLNSQTKSGLQEDGTLKFTSADLNNNNTVNIYNALKGAGYNYDTQTLLDISDTASYDTIKQEDINSSKQKGEAIKYLNAVQADAAAGNIPVGAIVQLNYGNIKTDQNHTYVYLGGTKFAKVNVNAYDNQKSGAYAIYVPSGYSLYDSSGKYSNLEQKWDNALDKYYYVLKTQKTSG